MPSHNNGMAMFVCFIQEFIMKNVFLLAGFVTTTLPIISSADTELSSASSHAPISVMGDHLHDKGEWMLSYRNMYMDMNGSLIGSDSISASDIVGTADNPGQFIVAPTEMSMDMHMIGGMYGLSSRVTLVAMVSYVDKEMSHITRAGGSFVTKSSGLGDTKVGALVGLFDNHFHRFHANIKVSLPTGSTDERDDTPAMQDAFLPYPMQIGSGTYDFIPGITYNGHSGDHAWSWGAQGIATIRTGTNDEGYTLGDRVEFNTWLARNLSKNLSLSLGLKYQDWDNIDGVNDVLNPLVVQTADTQLQGGNRLDLSLGANYIFNNGHRLAIEYADDVSQDLDGPQLQTDFVLTIGWQKSF